MKDTGRINTAADLRSESCDDDGCRRASRGRGGGRAENSDGGGTESCGNVATTHPSAITAEEADTDGTKQSTGSLEAPER